MPCSNMEMPSRSWTATPPSTSLSSRVGRDNGAHIQLLQESLLTPVIGRSPTGCKESGVFTAGARLGPNIDEVLVGASKGVGNTTEFCINCHINATKPLIAAASGPAIGVFSGMGLCFGTLGILGRLILIACLLGKQESAQPSSASMISFTLHRIRFSALPSCLWPLAPKGYPL